MVNTVKSYVPASLVVVALKSPPLAYVDLSSDIHVAILPSKFFI